MKSSSTVTRRKIEQWFSSRSWRPFEFQRKCWKTYLSGHDYLLHSTTGSGKTLAAWLGPIQEFFENPPPADSWIKVRGKQPTPPLTVLWITPLKALSYDTEASLRQPLEDLEIPWSLERRTGDSTAAMKARQRTRLPTTLITTPESLTLLLSYPESLEQFRWLRCIVVDEWHELLGTKRGIQTELALARLRKLAPKAVRCGLSATLGSLEAALACLCGSYENARHGAIIHGSSRRKIELSSIIPEALDKFPWAGHLGLIMAKQVAEEIDGGRTTLVFTNTRNQTENWYRELLRHRPDWAGQIALHHGSLDATVRRWVEDALRSGELKSVVCTSSLDLGVDFSEVDQVIQVGSPKGAARLVQRAGRSGHQPDGTSRLRFVPTHALELLELAAARRIVASTLSATEATAADKTSIRLESRSPLSKPLDCLSQHAVTLALAKPYTREEFAAEVRSTFSYREVTDEEIDWVMRFVVQGGESLSAYPDFHRIAFDGTYYSVTQPRTARLHRMMIGTIASDISVQLKYASGQTLGTVEESFIARLKPQDRFQFAGRTLELVHLREGFAIVRKAKGQPTVVPRWAGGRMPLTTEMSRMLRLLLDEAATGKLVGPEMNALKAILAIQKSWSLLPKQNEFLIESYRSPKLHQLCIFPFEGRLVHEGLAAVLAYRIGMLRPQTVSMAVNDYGFLLESSEELPGEENDLRKLLDDFGLVDAIHNSLNATEMSKRQFREIARIAGLIHPGYPGQPKRGKHLQASSNMFFDVFREYDPGNLLLEQARREVLEQQLQLPRLEASFDRIDRATWIIMSPRSFTPLAFPLVVERMREKMSSESLDARLQKLLIQLERESKDVQW